LKHQSDGSRAAANTNLMVFSLVWSELKPMIYCTQGEHANQYPISLNRNPFFFTDMHSWNKKCVHHKIRSSI
jgi:hypothetical protein